MHFSGQCRYGDEYVPQKQGTIILYVRQIVKTDQSWGRFPSMQSF